VLEAIIKASPLAIIALDVENRVLMWSDSAERIFGWTKEEVEGKPLPIIPAESQPDQVREHHRSRRSTTRVWMR